MTASVKKIPAVTDITERGTYLSPIYRKSYNQTFKVKTYQRRQEQNSLRENMDNNPNNNRQPNQQGPNEREEQPSRDARQPPIVGDPVQIAFQQACMHVGDMPIRLEGLTSTERSLMMMDNVALILDPRDPTYQCSPELVRST